MAESLSLDEWIEVVFSQPDDFREYHDPDCEECAGLSPRRRLELMAASFERSGSLLARFTDGQINQALYQSVAGMGSEYIHALMDDSLPWDLRQRAIRSFVPLFEQVTAVRCEEVLKARDEPSESPLNGTCYMWWDMMPLCSSRVFDHESPLNDECLSVMERILRIPHVACQESALHGLGHWKFNHPDEVVKIIDRFLERERNLRPELIGFAKAAKTGCIQLVMPGL